MNINSVIHQIKLVKASSDTTLCYQELIVCSDGRLFKMDQWMPFSNLSTKKMHRKKVEDKKFFLHALKPMSIWRKIESCVCKFI